MSAEDGEGLITGGWERAGRGIVPDVQLLRIQKMISTKLERIADAACGWETLFRHHEDGTLWERFFPRSDMHGGGPESLRRIDADSAEQKYGVKLDQRTNEH